MDAWRNSILETFDSDDRLAFLATLFRVACADKVSSLERDRLQPIAQWMEATEGELSQAMKLAYDQDQSLLKLLGGLRSPHKSLLIFRETCAVVWVNGNRSTAEAELLDELAIILGLSKDAKGILNSPLACSPEGERRFQLLLRGELES